MQNNDINDIDISSAYGKNLPKVFPIGEFSKIDRNGKKLMINNLYGLSSQTITDGENS